MSQLKLTEYSEIATALQIYDKDFIYSCIHLAKNCNEISDLTALVEILLSKRNMEDLSDYLISEGKRDLENISNGIYYRESTGNPRDAISLNYKSINSSVKNETLSLLINSAKVRGL